MLWPPQIKSQTIGRTPFKPLTNRLDMDNQNIENDNSSNADVTATEQADTTTETEAEELELTLEDSEPEVDVNKLQETNKKLYARLKNAEAKLKEKGDATKPVQATKQNINNKKDEQYLTREEAILIAKGFEDSELAKLKAIAKGSGCSLLDATKDEMFVVWKEKQVEENKKAKSNLGASRGSGSVRPEKSVSEMSREEHEAFVRKQFGN